MKDKRMIKVNKCLMAFAFCFVFMCMSVLLTGCGEAQIEKTTASTESGIPETTMIYIYHPDGYKVVVEDERYQLKQPDSTSASIEELMSAMAPYYEDRLSYTTYMIDSDNVVTLEFKIVGDYDDDYVLLAKAGLIRTLYQIVDISNIRITIYSEDDEVISDELLDRDSIYYYDEDTEAYK
ncbi:MAG: hypothetical protein IJ224_06045 [Lachnospiraceae bacterium]|nr:hypothetical protein [Lachnospiraceae bacterium]